MVSLSENDAFWAEIRESPELSEIATTIYGRKIGSDSSSRSSDMRLARAIAQDRKDEFLALISELGKREITDQSTWVQNDALVFFLIVGMKMFDVKMDNFSQVLELRERSTNGMEKVATRVYYDLLQGDLSLSGSGSFIKVVYRDLTKTEKLTPSEIRAVYSTLSTPNLTGSYTPFFKLLALRAYDIVFVSREHVVYESVPDLLDGFESLKKKLRLRDLAPLLRSLPITALLTLGALLGAAFAGGLAFKPITTHFEEIFQHETPLEILAFEKSPKGLPVSIRDFLAALPAQGPEAPLVASLRIFKGPDSQVEIKALVPTSLINSSFLILTDRTNATAVIFKGVVVDDGIIFRFDAQFEIGDTAYMLFQPKASVIGLADQLRHRISVSSE